MLISYDEVKTILDKFGIKINGALHIGAHDCEELSFYNITLGLNTGSIIWIDGNMNKVIECQRRNIPNVYYALISETDNSEVDFKITNNGQSSSILDFGSHSRHHPDVYFTETQKHKTVTIDTFFQKNNLNMEQYNFWNIDIQGAELLAIKGGQHALSNADALYLEVNTEEVYKGCALINDLDEHLSKHGFKRVITKMTQCGWGDALYVKTSKNAF